MQYWWSLFAGLVTQLPVQLFPQDIPGVSVMKTSDRAFEFKTGTDRFSPKDLIELARPGPGVANAPGDLVLVPIAKYSFEDKKNHKSLVVVSISSKNQLEIPLPNGGEAFWIGPTTIGHVEVTDKDSKQSSLYAIDIHVDSDASTLSTPAPPTLLGTFPTDSATNFVYSPSAGVLVFSDYVYEDGNLTRVPEGDKEWENRGNTAYVYDDGYERHWDTWVGPKRPSLFTVALTQSEDGKWHFGDAFTNVLLGTGHKCPVEPFGDTDDFDVSGDSIVYTAKDPHLPEAWHTRQNIYLVPLTGNEQPRELTSGQQGATHNPVFNAQGDKVAWLELEKDGHESDRAKIVIYDLKKDVRYTLTQSWDRSPDGLAFSKNSSFLYLTAGDFARGKIFVTPLPETPEHSSTNPSLPPFYTVPRALTNEGAAKGIQTLPGGRVLFSRSSLQGPDDVWLLHGLTELEREIERAHDEDPARLVTPEGAHVVINGVHIERITSLTKASLQHKQLSAPEDFYFRGHDNKLIHGLAVKPPGWSKDDKPKTWPVVMLIHGGPEGVWDDRWSTRWNPNVFAQQGYFVIAFNPAGSTTFGQELTDAIQQHWGSRPFIDMQAGWKYVLNKFPEIDADRAVAAGASWGGYAINWIQGHPEYGFNFKALFCHDGVFDATYNGFSTDELFFFNQEWGGRPWDPQAQEVLKKYNAREFAHKWRTPMLIVHGSKDYRLPETEGISAYHVLRQQDVDSRLVIFPDENHWVLDHGNSLKWHYEVFRWFDLYVGKDGNT